MILRKILKFVATRCQILRLKCTTFNFGWGSATDLAGGAYSTLPDLILLKEERGTDREGGVGEGEEMEGGDPQKLVYTPGVREIMKISIAQQFDLIGGAVIQTFAPGGN